MSDLALFDDAGCWWLQLIRISSQFTSILYKRLWINTSSQVSNSGAGFERQEMHKVTDGKKLASSASKPSTESPVGS
jgi:hypothetical protein